MAYQSFEDLEVWKRGCRLAVDVCASFYEYKFFTLKDQTQRAAISISSNIAEGAERSSNPDFIRFLHYSKGSCGELRTQLYIAKELKRRLGTTDYDIPETAVQETREISSMLHGLIRSLEEKA